MNEIQAAYQTAIHAYMRNLPNTRQSAIAIERLRESILWANASLQDAALEAAQRAQAEKAQAEAAQVASVAQAAQQAASDVQLSLVEQPKN